MSKSSVLILSFCIIFCNICFSTYHLSADDANQKSPKGLKYKFVLPQEIPPLPKLNPQGPQEQKVESHDQAKKLGIDKPTKDMKFETIESEKYNGEKYEVVIDEEEVKKTGMSAEQIRRTLREAMDSRNDRREDGSLTIEIGQDEEKQESNQESTDSKEKNKKIVAKIKKKDSPKDAHQDSKEPAVQKYNMGGKKFFKITSEGACKEQNKRLLEAVKFDSPA